MSIIKPFSIIFLLGLFGRLIGYLRDFAYAFFLGTNIVSDILLIIVRAYAIIQISLGQKYFYSPFIKFFVSIKERNTSSLKELTFTKNIFYLFLVPISIIFILLEIYLPNIINFFFKNLDFKNYDLIIICLRIILPIMVLSFTSSILIGILHSNLKFSAVAFTPIILNLFIILFMFISNFSSISILVLISLGFLFGTIVQTIFLFYFSKIKIIFYGGSKFKFGNDEKNFVYVVLPSIFVGFLILINNNLIAMYFGSAQAGNISYIYFANRFSHILVDIYGIALGTVLMPHISKAIIKKDFELTNKLIANSIKILFFGLLPACFGVFYLSDSLIYLFFERGAFNDISTANTSLLLRGYVPGVVALCLSSILMTLYFALSKTKLLVIITLTYTLISYFLLKILYDQFDIAGIGYGTSISAWIFVLILYVGIKKEQIFKISFEFLSFFFRSFFYSSLMIITLVILNNYISFDRNYMLVFMVCSGVIFYCLMILLFEKKISKSVFMYLRKINL